MDDIVTGKVAATVQAAKITSVEAIPLEIPFSSPFKIAQGGPRQTIETLLVRVHCDHDVDGVGETQAWRRQGSAETLPNLVNAIENIFTPLLVGRSPFDIAAIMADLNAALYNSLYAQAAVGDALYDLMGKLRGHFGDGVVLRVDANASMSFDAALRLLKKLEPFDIDAAEQPVAIWDIDGLAALARAVAIPIMADESVSTDHSLLEVIGKRAATVVQTKVAKNGGIYHIRKLWHLADAAGMRIYPGNHPSVSVATASAAQMAAAWPGPLMEGVFAVGVSGALAADVVREPIRPQNGEIAIPDGPGLGIELDEDRIGSLRLDR